MTHLLAAFSFFGALILLMIRKDITKLLLAPLLLASLAHAAPTDVAIECAGLPTGLTLTAKIVTAPNAIVSVAMTEGTGAAAGYYYCTNAQVAAQSPTDNKTYSGVLNDGTSDVATFTLYWYGTESRRVIVAGDSIGVSEEAAGEIIQPALDAIDALPTAAENATQLLATATSDAGAGTIGRLWHYALAGYSASGELAAGMFANQPLPEVDEETLATAVADALQGQLGQTQPRQNRKPAPGFTIQVSRRKDGTYKATPPIRLTTGAVNNVFVFIDMSPLFGPDDFVETVGTPTVDAGTLEAGEDRAPRDTYAMVELDGTADEDGTVTVPVTMTSGTTVPVVFDVEVLE